MKLIKYLEILDKHLLDFQNVIGLASIFVSIVALIVAIIAFKDSRLKPSLNLWHQVYNQQSSNEYYKNGDGKIVFFAEEHEGYGKEIMVSICVPIHL